MIFQFLHFLVFTLEFLEEPPVVRISYQQTKVSDELYFIRIIMDEYIYLRRMRIQKVRFHRPGNNYLQSCKGRLSQSQAHLVAVRALLGGAAVEAAVRLLVARQVRRGGVVLAAVGTLEALRWGTSASISTSTGLRHSGRDWPIRRFANSRGGTWGGCWRGGGLWRRPLAPPRTAVRHEECVYTQRQFDC